MTAASRASRAFVPSTLAFALIVSAALVQPVSAAPTNGLAATVSQTDRDAAVRQFVKRLDPDHGPTEYDRSRVRMIDAQAANQANALSPREDRGFDADYNHSINVDAYFSPGSSRISMDGRFVLSLVARGLRAPDLRNHRFLIGGYASATGATEAGIELAWQRADTIRQVLIEDFGIAPQRLVAMGFGDDQPIARAKRDLASGVSVAITLILPVDRTREAHLPNPIEDAARHPLAHAFSRRDQGWLEDRLDAIWSQPGLGGISD